MTSYQHERVLEDVTLVQEDGQVASYISERQRVYSYTRYVISHKMRILLAASHQSQEFGNIECSSSSCLVLYNRDQPL